MKIDEKAIQDAIVAQAVQKIIGDDHIYERVKIGINARIEALFSERVEGLVSSTIDQIVKDGFDRAYTKRDGFGRAIGEPTSISKELERMMSDYWKAQVGRDGKPCTDSYTSVPRAEWMMMTMCADDFKKEMAQHVINVGGRLKDHFREVLHDHVTKMLSDVFLVKSVGDVALTDQRKDTGRAIIDPPAKPI
jgi:hypothetical protein